MRKQELICSALVTEAVAALKLLKKFTVEQKNASTTLKSLNNIEQFVKACSRKDVKQQSIMKYLKNYGISAN